MTRSGVGDSRTSPTSSPERGKLGTRREVHMVTRRKGFSRPQDTTGSKNGSQVQHLARHGNEGTASHVGGGEEGPKKRQGTFDEDGGVAKWRGCRGTSGYLQLDSRLGSRRARASTVGPSESCPAPSVSKAIEIA